MNEKKWEEIGEAVNDIEANILKGFLEAQGFDVFLSQEGYQRAMGISGIQDATVRIMVPSDQAEEAKQVLEDYYAGKYEDSED